MCKLIRFINQGIKHFFIIDGEYFGDGCHEFKNRLPDSIADGQFVAFLSYLSEEFAYSLVVHETLHCGEYVVLEYYERSGGNLCCEVGRLTLAKFQQSLTFLEDDLQRPVSGVYFVGFKKSIVKIGRKQSAPRVSLAAAYEEETYMSVSKDDIDSDMPASELAAVSLLVPLVRLPENGRSRELLVLKAVFGFTILTDLYHPDVVAPDMAGTDEAHYLSACKPAVSQHIAETNFVPDGPANHIDGEINLAHGVLVKAGMDGSVPISFCAVSPEKLLPAHTIVALSVLLSEDGKIKKHLTDVVGNAEEEGLEAKDAAVLQMGADTSYALHSTASLGKVRIVNHQAGVIRLVVATDDDLCPKLSGNVVHQLAPVGAAVVEELIEHIFTTTKLAA